MAQSEKSTMDNSQAMTDLRTVIEAPEGRRFLRRVLEQSNILSPSYAAGDALGTAYNEGLRAVGLWLKAEMDRARPGSFTRIMGPESVQE